MPRVTHVKSARKDNPVAKKGESYYWWKFRYGGKRFSLTYPRPSQLTQSAYLGAVYDLIDMANNWEIDPEDDGAVENMRDELYGSVEEIQSECQESLDNMPESLQYSPTGELLQERIDACDNAMNELDSIQEPDQWQEVRDAREEHEEWLDAEPQAKDFKLDEDGDDTDFKDAKLEWIDEEPEIEDMEDWDRAEAVEAIEGMLV